MKKTTLIITLALFALSLVAVEFDWDGEFRARAAMYNDYWGDPGGHVDNRLQLGITSEITRGLNLRASVDMVGPGYDNVVWGETGGAIGDSYVLLQVKEAWIDYRIEQIKSNVRLGQQTWADHRGLVLDDTFSGITLKTDLAPDVKATFGYGKYEEGFFTDRYDDMQGFLVNVEYEGSMTAGMDAYLTWNRFWYSYNDKPIAKNFSFLPYFVYDLDPITIDGVIIAQMVDTYPSSGVFSKVKSELKSNFGVALNAKTKMDQFTAGIDLVFMNDILTYWRATRDFSRYYQNGLYIFGPGEHNDDLGIWAFGTDAESYLGATLSGKYQMTEKLAPFGAFGFINKGGMELNGGLEYQIIPELLNIAAFGAYGIVDKDLNNKNAYAFGTTLKVEF